MAFRGCRQHLAKGSQLLVPVDPAGRVVRTVDDDRPGAWRDGRRDGVSVEREVGRAQANPDRSRPGGDDHQFIEEPWRRKEDDLIAFFAQRTDRHAEGTEGAGRHRHVGRLVVDAGSVAQRFGDDLAWLRLAELVGEPILVSWYGIPLERIHQPWKGHLLRIAERKVGDIRVEVMALPRSIGEPVEDVVDAADHPIGTPFPDDHSDALPSPSACPCCLGAGGNPTPLEQGAVR